MPGNQIEFFYNEEAIVSLRQRTNAVALNPLDTTEAYTLAESTKIYVVNNEKGSYGELNIFYEVREKNDKIISTQVFNVVTEYGDLSFTIVPRTVVFEKGDEYETYASYRTGIFTESQSPKITVIVLGDENRTRKYTVSF